MAANWTTPAKDWTTGDVVTAALLDTHLRDNMDYLQQEFVAKLGQWTSYVPTWTQGATISKTVTYSRYIKLGRLVIAQGVLVATSNGTANTAIQVSLPVAAVQVLATVGQIWWIGSSLYYETTAALGTSTSFVGVLRGTSLNLGQTSAGWDNQVASGDTYSYHIFYESAS
jgi:hypothetical protein